MKKVIIATAALALGVSLAQAESYPAYGPDSYKATHESGGAESAPRAGNFYVGLGYSYVNANVDIPAFYFGSKIDFDIQSDNINFIAGYEFNQYFAVEARYTTGVSDLDFSLDSGYYDDGMTWGGDISNLGLYLKPKYQVGDVALYALLGYGHIRLDIDNIGDNSENEFQWGLGMSMDVGASIIGGTKAFAFVDYIRFYDDNMNRIDTTIDSINVGIAFKF